MSTDLDAVIGAIVTAVARARRLADEETAAIAEHYRQHPLLSDLSVPRVRLPEVTVDVPLIIDDHDPGAPPAVASPAAINTAARTALKEAAEEAGVSLPSGALSAFRDRFREEATRLPPDVDVRTAYGDLSDRVLGSVVGDLAGRRAEVNVLAQLRPKVREAVETIVVERPGRPANLAVTVLTAAIREVPPEQVTRVRIHLREEGVEWTTIEDDDGTARHRLVPE